MFKEAFPNFDLEGWACDSFTCAAGRLVKDIEILRISLGVTRLETSPSEGRWGWAGWTCAAEGGFTGRGAARQEGKRQTSEEAHGSSEGGHGRQVEVADPYFNLLTGWNCLLMPSDEKKHVCGNVAVITWFCLMVLHRYCSLAEQQNSVLTVWTSLKMNLHLVEVLHALSQHITELLYW